MIGRLIDGTADVIALGVGVTDVTLDGETQCSMPSSPLVRVSQNGIAVLSQFGYCGKEV